MEKLKIITSTTREGRKGIVIAEWITQLASRLENVDVELLDLAVINLPMMNEPHHPRLHYYTHEHTKRWSEKITEADAFIIVLAEYNYGFPAPIKNAIDYLFQEWKYKPVGLVSYGGASGGLRSTQMLKQVLTTLSMVPLTEQVNIHFFTKFINDEEKFVPDESIEKSAHGMIAELRRWSVALKSMRNSQPV